MKLMYSSFLVVMALLFSACDSKSVKEVTGTTDERIKIVSKIITNNIALPSKLLDANFIQDVNGDGIGPADVKSFWVVKVAPADLSAWQAILGPLEKHNTPANYAFSSKDCDWWLKQADFPNLKFYSPKSVTGRANGWIGIATDGRIYMFTFSD